MNRSMVSFARLRRVVFIVGVAALLGSLAVSVQAALPPIVWGSPQTVSGDSDVDTT